MSECADYQVGLMQDGASHCGYHQTKRKGTQPKTKDVECFMRIYHARKLKGRGIYKCIDLIVVSIGGGWCYKGFWQEVYVTRRLGIKKSILIWEYSSLEEGLTTGSDIAENYWVKWRLRWSNWPWLHLEGNRCE